MCGREEKEDKGEGGIDVKRLIAGIGILIFLLTPVMALAEQKAAEDTGAIYEARNGILQVNLSYIDGNQEAHVLQGGSGFLLGNEEGAGYLLTNYHCLNVTEELRKQVVEQYGLKEEDKNSLQFQIQVVVKRDIVINASVVTGSEEMDFAVLKLSQMIYDRAPLSLNKDPDTIVETSQVYTLGFPEDIQAAQDVSFYTKEDVSVMNGIVSKKTTVGGVLYIQHSAVVTSGNAGGPLLNEAGQVIGMNQAIMDDGYYYSVHISEITAVLDALGIAYIQSEPETEDAPDVSVLEIAIATAEALPMEGYTKESAENFRAVLTQAKGLLEKEELTQEEINNGVLSLKNAETALVIKGGINYLLIGGSIILFLLILVIVLLVLVVRKGEKAPKEEKPKKETKKESKSSYMPFSGNMISETTLLKPSGTGIGAGETTVLNSDASADLVTATLTHSKTNENIVINKVAFYLGKDALRADYCIRNNPSVSRNHAVIKQMNGGFYLEDLQATNGTFHNGRKLQPSQSVKLSDGDRIRLANEEFLFNGNMSYR